MQKRMQKRTAPSSTKASRIRRASLAAAIVSDRLPIAISKGVEDVTDSEYELSSCEVDSADPSAARSWSADSDSDTDDGTAATAMNLRNRGAKPEAAPGSSAQPQQAHGRSAAARSVQQDADALCERSKQGRVILLCV